MTDLVQRLRESATQARAIDRAALLNEAADEIERLHSALSGYTDGIPLRTEIKFTLTSAEREAVEWCVEMAVLHATECDEEVAALRGLLERSK